MRKFAHWSHGTLYENALERPLYLLGGAGALPLRWQIWLIFFIFAWAACGAWAADATAFLPGNPKYLAYFVMMAVPLVAGILMMLDDLRQTRRGP